MLFTTEICYTAGGFSNSLCKVLWESRPLQHRRNNSICLPSRPTSAHPTAETWQPCWRCESLLVSFSFGLSVFLCLCPPPPPLPLFLSVPLSVFYLSLSVSPVSLPPRPLFCLSLWHQRGGKQNSRIVTSGHHDSGVEPNRGIPVPTSVQLDRLCELLYAQRNSKLFSSLTAYSGFTFVLGTFLFFFQ